MRERLIELIGGTIYAIGKEHYQEVIILSVLFTEKTISGRRSHINVLYDFNLRGRLYLDDYGKKWTFTKEEAEAASKGGAE